MDPTTNKITISRDVVFDVVPTWDQKEKQIIEEPIYEDPLASQTQNKANVAHIPRFEYHDESHAQRAHLLSEIYESYEFASFSSERDNFEVVSKDEHR